MEHTLTIQGQAGGRKGYHFAVSGPLRGESLTREDNVDHSFANGAVGKGIDRYEFDGELLSLDVDGWGKHSEVRLDGDVIWPINYPKYFMTIERSRGSADAGYSFVADGLQGVSVTNGSFNPPADDIEGEGNRKRATGSVGAGMDTYVFKDNLKWIYANRNARIHINGERVRPDAPVSPLGVRGIHRKAEQNETAIKRIKNKLSGLTSKVLGMDVERRGVRASGGASHTVTNEVPELGCVARDYSTQGDVTMHVGRGKEYESLQAAFNDVPHHVNHNVQIWVYGRTRDTNAAHIHGVSMANHVDFNVFGKGDGAVINSGGVNISIDGKMDHIEFRNLKFEWISQCKDARFVDCDFNGNGTGAFSGKMGGKMLINCDIGAGRDDHGIFSIGNEMCDIRGGVVRGQESSIQANGASVHVRNNVRCDAPQWITGGSDSVHVGGVEIPQ